MTTMNEERAGFESELGSALIEAQGKFALSRAYDEGNPYTFIATKWAFAGFQAGAAWQRAQGAVPEGYAIVQVEPTPAMRVIGARGCSSLIQPDQAGEVWRAMLGAVVVPAEYAFAAAPAHPAERQEQGEVQRLREQWVPASEHLPESERTVLAYYTNSHGKGRRVRAEYIAAKTKSADDGWDSDSPADYDEQADEYFWPAGWYEVMDNWDDLTHMVIHEGEVTHWMPLPAAPALAASTGQEVEK